MKKIFIIFLLIILSTNFSLAKNNEKITVAEIKDILLNIEDINDSADIKGEKFERLKKSGTWEKRLELKGTAKCMYKNLYRKKWYDTRPYDPVIKDFRNYGPPTKECYAVHLKRVIHRTKQGEKRRPGDVFYALEAIEDLVFDEKKYRKFIEHNVSNDEEINNFEPNIKCHLKHDMTNVGMGKIYYCPYFSKYTLKRIEKFKKNPSKEKVLGKPLLNFIKQVRLVRDFRDKLGNGNLSLLGDLLNAVVADVTKNNIRPDLKKRRLLLEKYSLVLKNITKNFNEDNYKSIDKDISKLSGIFNQLNTLDKTTNKQDINIDESINIIKDINKLIQTSAISAKENKENKDLTLSAIYFMEYLIDSILSTIPERYSVVLKPLTQDMFTEEDLAEVEDIINFIIKRNKTIKSVKLINSRNSVNEYINTSNIIKSLEDFIALNEFDNDASYKIAKEVISDNLDVEIFKDVKKLVKKMTQDESSDLNKELSKITKEVANVAKEATKSSEVSEVTQNRIGNLSIQTLVGASRRGYINLGRSF